MDFTLFPIPKIELEENVWVVLGACLVDDTQNSIGTADVSISKIIN